MIMVICPLLLFANCILAGIKLKYEDIGLWEGNHAGAV